MSRQLLTTIILHTLVLSAVMAVFATAQPGEEISTWELRSRHFKFGMPVCVDHRYNFTPTGATAEEPGVSVLVREGFVVGHCDKYKAPIWVTTQWTRELQALVDDTKAEWEAENPDEDPRDFKRDPELPEYAQAQDVYGFANSGFQRGHMARQDDNWSWGYDNIRTGCYMSNIAPQTKPLNTGKAWRELEDAVSAKVKPGTGSIAQMWITTGAVYPDGAVDPDYSSVNGLPAPGYFANGIGAPTYIYKIMLWKASGNRWQMRGYLFPQEPDSDLAATYLVPVDMIEEDTGLDFFPEADTALNTDVLEAFDPRSLPVDKQLWGSMPTT